jgi:hypothetical protein
VSIREEVQAATAAHRDLGPGYDTAVAEGLVERIGEEIDRRVDARLAAGYAPRPSLLSPHREPRRERAGGLGFSSVVLALGSMALAIGATAAVLHPENSAGQVSGGQAVIIALIWLVIAAINVTYARHR